MIEIPTSVPQFPPAFQKSSKGTSLHSVTTTDTGLVPLAAVGPVSVVIRMPFCVTFMVFPFQLSPKESHMTKVYSQTLLVSQTSVANSVGLLHALESVSEHTART